MRFPSFQIRNRSELLLLVLGVLIVAIVLIASVSTSIFITPAPPITQIRVRLVGSDYRFQFQYQQANLSELNGCTKRDLIIPADSHTELLLSSEDYVYTLEIAAAELYEAAVPGATFETEFTAPPPGRYPLLGSQMCGQEHPELLGHLIVYSQADFQRFLSELPSCPANQPIANQDGDSQ